MAKYSACHVPGQARCKTACDPQVGLRGDEAAGTGAALGGGAQLQRHGEPWFLGDTRTAQNLLETGRAAFLSVLPGETAMDTRGTRLYLKVRAMEKEGPNLDALKSKIRAKAGDRAASRIQYAVFFDIEGTRPLIDWAPPKS